jgi:uncharacterized protein (DUF2237 family)
MMKIEILHQERLTGTDLMVVFKNKTVAIRILSSTTAQRWCLCVSRWKQALDAGVAPPVDLMATHETALQFVSLADLQQQAISL